MVEPITSSTPQDPLREYLAAQQPVLMAAPEWSALQGLDAMREKVGSFFGALHEQETFEYVRLQKAWVDAQHTLEKAVQQLTEAFEQHAGSELRAELKKLTGQDIDPTVTRIYTRYKASGGEQRGDAEGAIKVASLTLWDAACLNYDGLTGWTFPGRTGLAGASYLDDGVSATASQFIALVRRLDIGAQLNTQLQRALQANGSLGRGIMALATAELEFALIEALRDTTASRVDRHKYQQVKRALAGEVRWGRVEEMRLFIPHGVDNTSWIPQHVGLTGQYVSEPAGDCLSIPHLVFAVSDCPGAFSFFPNRPGGSLRHHDSHREACEEFYVAFHGFYRKGKVDWLYQAMSLRDSARLINIVKAGPPPDFTGATEAFARLLYRLAQAIPTLGTVQKIGYVRVTVQQVPLVSLSNFYVQRCADNLKELANETPGFMPTMIELAQTLISEIITLLLTPVPGALKGLGRVRAFALFVAMERALIDGGHQALQGQPDELLQGFVDLADLLISARLHTRLARSVQRRHQRLYRQLSQRRTAAADAQQLTNPQLLERMLGSQHAAARDMQAVLDASGTSRNALQQVWEGVPPSASLVEAVHRFNADRLIDWVIDGDNARGPGPVGAVQVMAPLLTQLDAWPVGTALSIENHQGQEIRRYSKDATRPTTQVVTVTQLENYQFAYATPRRIALHLPQAIVDMLPAIFSAGEQPIRQQLAALANTLKFDLFDALTRFADASRAMPSGAGASVRNLLPDRIVQAHPAPAVITQLQALHPQLSLARLLEVLREHPLSAHQQTQLLHSQLQPEALYSALRAAHQVGRREAIVDGLLHPRRFDRQTQHWATEFAAGVLRGFTGQALVVSPKGQAVPYSLRGPKDRTLVVIDQDQGQFAPYDPTERRVGATVTGADSFYVAIVSQISELGLSVLRWNQQQAITEFRYQVAQALLRKRAPDGSFYPRQREITQYASTADMPSSLPEPDALGLYSLGPDRYLALEGQYFKVDRASTLEPWRIRHPSLEHAYAPVLVSNGAGAWRHEWENPLTWDGQKPFWRLGPVTRSLSPDAIAQIQIISGVTPGILRRVHVRNERPPVLLLDTIERFTIQQRVKAGVAQGQGFYAELLGELGPEAADVLVGVAGASRVDQVTVLESKVEIDPPQMERNFFEALCHKRSSDPLAQLLQRKFIGLTATVAESLVRQASADEVQSLEAGRVPLTLTPYIRWWLKQLRKARALEGLFLPAAASHDSAKLILHTLPDIHGWPPHLRVEVRAQARLLDSIGPVDAALKRVLEPVAGHYQAYSPQTDGTRQSVGNPGAFLPVLLAALPPRERQALGYTHVGGVEELLQEIGHRQEPQGASVDALLGIGWPAWYNPPRRMADGRMGYPLSGGDGWGPVDRQQVARMRELFPSKTDKDVFEILENLSDSVRERGEAIDALFKEREALEGVLERWSAAEKGETSQAAARREAAERIRRCWRKEDSTRGVMFELSLDDLNLNELPEVNAHFGHVMQLSLSNNQLQALPRHFLRRFPALRTLYLDGNRLVQIPHEVSQLWYLKRLYLSNNRIRPDLWDVSHLQSMTRLIKLDLSNNPLGRGQRLNLYGLKQLRVLKLRNTQINVLPLGAVTLENLRTFDLRDNAIKVLTLSDLFLHETVHRAMNLRGNDLSPGTLQRLSNYRRRPGYQDIYFGLWGNGEFPLPSVERWLVAVPLNEMAQWRGEWELLAGERMADRFFNLLWHLSSYPPLIAPEHQALRQDLTQRVWNLIEAANHNGRLRRILFEEPLNDMSAGIDGWLLSLNDLELAMLPVQMLSGNVANAGPDFINYYRALRRLAAIRYYVQGALELPTDREICVHILVYRLALAVSLDLPLALPGRFGIATAVPDADSVNELRRRILRDESQFNWPAKLEDEEYWVAFLERKYSQRFEAALKQFHRALELATAKVGTGEMNEAEYKNYIETLAVPMNNAKTGLVRELTRSEWMAFVNS